MPDAVPPPVDPPPPDGDGRRTPPPKSPPPLAPDGRRTPPPLMRALVSGTIVGAIAGLSLGAMAHLLRSDRDEQ